MDVDIDFRPTQDPDVIACMIPGQQPAVLVAKLLIDHEVKYVCTPYGENVYQFIIMKDDYERLKGSVLLASTPTDVEN